MSLCFYPGPTMIRLEIGSYGGKWWFLHNVHHRLNGPAINYRDGQKVWYVNGKCHRTTGPAVIFANGLVEYWVNGRQVTEYEHMFLNNELNV